MLLVLLTLLTTHAWGQTYKPARVDERKAMPVVTMQGAGMQSQQMMSGGAYNGTVYEPFSNATPSEASNPAKAPSGPLREQASGRNAGEVDPEGASDQSPIGEPWVMMLLALGFGGVIAIRAHKKRIVQTETQNNETMKTSGKYLAITLLMLTMGIGNAWGADASNARIYFDNSSTNWSNYVQLLGGYKCNDCTSHSSGTGLGKIANTNNLWTCTWTWGGYAYFYFVNAEGSWGDNNQEPWDRKGSYAHTSTRSDNVGSDTYLYVPNSGNNTGFAAATGKLSGGYSDLNYTQTIEQKLHNGSSYVASTVTLASTIQVSSYYLSNEYTATSTGNQAITSGNSSTTCDAARTATVTYYVSGVQSGYEFIGWYEGDTQKQTAATYTYNATGANTVTARFAPTYTVNIPAGVHGTVAVTGGSTGNNTIGQNPVEITASSPIAGCYFAGWILEGGVSLAGGYSLTDATIKVTATGTGTVTANFASRYALRGSDKDNNYSDLGMPGWSDESYTLDYVADNDFRRTVSLKGNINGSNYYKFRLYDKVLKKNLGYEYAGSISLNGGECWLNEYKVDVTFTLDGSDDVTFKIVSVAGSGHVDLRVLTSDGATTSHTVNFNSRNFFADGTQTTATTGGTVTAVDWKSYELTTGQKAKAGKAVRFTATPEEGYTFAGWYSDESCTSAYSGSGVSFSGANNSIMDLTINGNKTVYAKFVETATTVSLFASPSSIGHIEVETATGVWTTAKDLSDPYHINVGVHTHYNIKAVVDLSSRFFEKWRVSAIDQDFYLGSDTEADYDEDHATTVIYGKGNGRATQLLYADFTELEKIYFRNVFDDGSTVSHWENVYVYFGTSYNGSSKMVTSNSESSYIVKMTAKTDDSDVYWGYIPRSFTRDLEDDHDGTVAFSNHDFGTSYTFYEYEAVHWESYTQSLNMCIPNHAVVGTYNSTKYHDCYWKKYNSYVGFLGGYYLMIYDGSSYGHALPDYYFTIVDENTIQTTYTIKDAGVAYKFMIESFAEIKYITQASPIVVTGKDVYADDCNEVNVTQYDSGKPYFILHPNMEGTYTFTIDQSGEKMKLTVHYPVEVGDYRIKHSYNDGSAKTAYSNAVKAAKVADTDTVSLFLYESDANNATTLQKCTSIDAVTKMPVFSDCASGTTKLSGCNSLDKSGVYKIGITVADDAVSNIPEIEPYTGHYYIRVKGANTRNHLTNGEPQYGSGIGTKFTPFIKNSAFADTYDHYWVDWFLAGSAQSVQATIQNDYNPDLAGKVAVGISTTTDGANVRYGYDSESNTLTYQMITGAGSSVKITNTQGSNYVEILTTPPSTYTDAYNSAQSATDAQNWMYEFDALVKEGSTATITSSYDDEDVILAENKKLLGGDGGDTHYVDVIYDFKTNRLITAWKPNPATDYKKTISLESNLMLVRTEDGSPTLLNLIVDPEDGTKEGELTDIKQIYTVMEFTKENWDKSSWTTIGGGYTDAFFWISLPYDCYVSEIFGMDKYGDQWVIQTYHGDYRAQKGWWAETESWWYDLDRDDIMKANQGYVIRLTNLKDYGNVFNTYGVTHAYLYFPSANASALNIGRLGESTTTTVPEHKCEIWRGKETNTHEGDPNYDRRFIDSNWNIIGSPCFNSAKISTTGWADGTTEGQTVNYDNIKSQLQFFYTWEIVGNTPKYTVKSSLSDFEFKATHAYFVQYAGELTWVPYPATPFVGFKAPTRTNEESTNQTLRLTISQNDAEADATYISRMAEGATEGYDLNMDLSKVMNSRKANIYTLAGYYKMAGNCLPDTVSMVPVGVRTYAAGTYTFSIPEGTNGTGVVLVDNVTGTRTNLALTDYTITLAKGTFDGRFSLELSPIAQTQTDVEHTSTDGMNGVRKVMVDGILYIVKDGKVFDARGNRVQ